MKLRLGETQYQAEGIFEYSLFVDIPIIFFNIQNF